MCVSSINVFVKGCTGRCSFEVFPGGGLRHVQRPGPVSLRWLQRPELRAFPIMFFLGPRALSGGGFFFRFRVGSPRAEVAMFAYGQTGAGKQRPRFTPCQEEGSLRSRADLRTFTMYGSIGPSPQVSGGQAQSQSWQVELGTTQARPHGPLPSCRCLINPLERRSGCSWEVESTEVPLDQARRGSSSIHGATPQAVT